MQGEGTPDEKRVVLGCFLDTRRFRIHLPSEKFGEWINIIITLIKASVVTTRDVESTIDQINHAGHIIP